MKNKANYNRELEIIDTPEKAYLLGLLYADGSITSNNGYYIKLKLQYADKEILDNIVKEFPFFTEPSKDNNSYYIICYRKELYYDLVLNGMHERKSFENKNLMKIPDIQYKWDFIRGFFDGDGNVNIDNKGRIAFSFYTVSQSFTEDLVLFLKDNNIRPVLMERQRGTLQLMYTIKISNQESSLIFISNLYKNDILYIRRKRETIDSFKPVDLSAVKSRRRPKSTSVFNIIYNTIVECGHCKSNNLIKVGVFYSKCNDCNKLTKSTVAHNKQGELLENPLTEDNQQPSLISNDFEGSTTNSRTQTSNVEGSNANTSALHLKLISATEGFRNLKLKLNDDIV